jgi:hypothetical protein
MSIWKRALWCSRDVVGLGAEGKEVRLEMSNKSSIVGTFIPREWCWIHQALNIEIKTIHSGVSKRSRLASQSPCRSLGTKCAPKEFRKVSGYGWTREVVISRSSAYGQ